MCKIYDRDSVLPVYFIGTRACQSLCVCVKTIVIQIQIRTSGPAGFPCFGKMGCSGAVLYITRVVTVRYGYILIRGFRTSGLLNSCILAFMDSDSQDDDTSCGRLSLMANRLYFSRAWSAFYMCMVVFNIAAIIALISVHVMGEFRHENPWVIFIEVIVNLTLFAELSVRMAAQQRMFFKDACNIFDFCIMILCLATLVIFIRAPLEEKDTAVIGTVVLGARYGVVAIRLIHLTYILKKRKGEVDSSSLAVDFSLFQDENVEGDGAVHIGGDGGSNQNFKQSRADSFGSDF